MPKHLSIALLLSLALQMPTLNPHPARPELPLGSQIDLTSLSGDILPSYIPARMHVTVTGYSSTPDQTDDTPFIAASGKHVHDGMLASNFLKFGTKVKIPELFGDKVFVVEDRMNRRYYDRVDVWFPDRNTALKFGMRTDVEIIIL